MVIFAALFIVLFIAVLFAHVFLHRIKDFLQEEDVLRMFFRQFSANQNVNRGITGNTEDGEGVEPLTPSMSSARADGTEFEVFLSFRGEDTRKRFIGHLYDGLEQRGISTFIDGEKLEKGEEIDNLLEYIKRSKIFVPIFSKRFAESKWCLKEVTKSVECGKEMIPVFFDVEPLDVRNQTGLFKSAFKEHESNKKLNQEEVRNWREALKKVGSLSGFTLKDMNWDEAKLKRAVIERVLTRLNKTPFEVAKHPVGIETRVNDVKKMLENGGNINGVHVVGIHGMGGLGKTTIYNDLAEGFNGATCFLSNIREKSGQPNGLVDLQKQVFLEIFKDGNIFLSDVAHGVSLIKQRASGKRVLLILDDVDSREQLDALAGGRDWFGSGSVIIITTRDEKVLLSCNMKVKQHEIYMPQELNVDESLKLFMHHAFNDVQREGEYLCLSKEVVHAAGGLPLTLEVLGSLLTCDMDVQEWKDTLEKLKKIPLKEVQQRLKLSYDNLEDLEKKIFLDIACFFIGEDREYATYMWEGCHWFPNAAIKVLVQRSLVKICLINEVDEKCEVFEMHDQIRDMGRAIVDEECSRKLQKKSRLWNNQDSRDLLQRKGPETIDAEGIQILNHGENDCTVGAQCFENMPNLRYLYAYNVKFQGTFPCFPTDLKWLQLESCHFDSPPSDFNLEKLVILELHYTNMAPILRLKAFERLNVLSLRRVETKITLDFTNLPSLVKLQFLDCSALTTIDESIGKLKKLTHLSTPGCRLLQKLPDSIWRLSSLEVLNISHCQQFSSLPERLGELGSLKKLDLSFTRIKRLPDSICRLSSLEMLCLEFCEELCSIPEGLGDMESLKKIDLSWTGIEFIPDSIGHLTNLVELPLCGSRKLRELPDSICKLKLLKSLDLTWCLFVCSLPERLGDMEKLEKLILANTGIEIIPDSACQLKLLKSLNLNWCVSLRSLPERLGDMEKLETLFLNKTIIEVIPDSICQLKLLKSLSLRECFSLCGLPERLGDMEKMEELILDSTRIEAIPDSVGRLDNLRVLSLKDCKLIKALPISIRQLSSIQRLEMSGTNFNIAEIDLPPFAAINFIEFTGSSSELLGLCDQIHKALEILRLKDATIEDLPDCVGMMENLKELQLECEMLKELPNWIGSLKQLRQLILKCENLKALPNSIGSLKQMLKLILYCMNLESLPDSIGELENVDFFIIDSAKLKALPNSIALLGRVNTLELHCMSLEALPDSIGCLKKLTKFEVSSNSLEALPDSIGCLKKLTKFEVPSNSLEALPDSIGSLKHVWTLTLKCPNLEALPDSIGELESLRHFEVDCDLLKYLPNSMERLQSLQKLHLHCDNFTAPPDFVRRLKKLQTFSFSSKKLKYLDAAIFETLGGLCRLSLRGCENLEGMLASIGEPDFARLSSLESLDLKDCKGLEYLPQLPSSLRSLNASGCTNLRKMSDISNLKSLKNLSLGGCKQLEDVPGLEIISCNLEILELPGPCDFTGCCHFSHDFKNKVFEDMTFEKLKMFKMSGSLVPGSAKGQQQLQFMLPRLPSTWLRGAVLVLQKVLSPICIAIIAFEKIAEVDGDDEVEVELDLEAESIVNTVEGAHCYTIQVTMDVSQLQNVFVLLAKSR